jgi:lysozyme family protein
MASFIIAYKNYIEPNEGGYAKLAHDKGGRTYAGIAENYNKQWTGWPFIDMEEKRLKGKPIPNNTKFPNLQFLVTKFYEDRWNANRFGEINNQDVANLLFDYHVHSQSSAIKAVQKILNIAQDGKMGNQTIQAINKANPAELHTALLNQRRAFLNKVIANNKGYENFRKGFEYRLAKFPQLVKENAIPIGLMAAATGVVLLIALANKKKNENEYLKAA